MDQPTQSMPEYVSHKKVWALKIAAIEFNEDRSAKVAPWEKGFAAFDVSAEWGARFGGSEADLGYYVRYKDGYESWSPTKAFEEGYTPAR